MKPVPMNITAMTVKKFFDNFSFGVHKNNSLINKSCGLKGCNSVLA